jgi:HK97 family phage major capsid protein
LNPKPCDFIVKASRELLQDSINVEQVLEGVFAGVTAQALDQNVIFGTGADGQIKGLTEYTINEYEMADNGDPLTNFDPLVLAYRQLLDQNAPPPTAYLMAPRTWETLQTLKDSQNRYLTPPAALDGIPMLETTHFPVDETQGTASNASRILTGYFPDLIVGIRQEMRVEVLRERFANSYEIGFLVHMRADAIPMRTGSFGQILGITPA